MVSELKTAGQPNPRWTSNLDPCNLGRSIVHEVPKRTRQLTYVGVGVPGTWRFGVLRGGYVKMMCRHVYARIRVYPLYVHVYMYVYLYMICVNVQSELACE